MSRPPAGGGNLARYYAERAREYEVLKNFPSEEELLETVGLSGREAAVELLDHYWLLRDETS